MQIISRESLIKEQRRDVAARLTTLNRVQRGIYRAHRWTKKVDGVRIADAILKERLRVAESQIDNLLSRLGCRKQKARLTNRGIHDILLSESQTDAESILNTRNYELIGVIQKAGVNAKPSEVSKLIKGWESARADWKGEQVATWTVGSTRHFISEEFFSRNRDNIGEAEGSAILLGKDPAAEKICQGWLNRGRVTIQEALDSKWPPHIGCVHVWEFDPKKVPFFRRRKTCPLLWRGE